MWASRLKHGLMGYGLVFVRLDPHKGRGFSFGFPLATPTKGHLEKQTDPYDLMSHWQHEETQLAWKHHLFWLGGVGNNKPMSKS